MSKTTNDLHAEALAIFARLKPSESEKKGRDTVADYNKRRKDATAALRPVLAEMQTRFEAGETVASCTSMKQYCGAYQAQGCLTYRRVRQILTGESQTKKVKSLHLGETVNVGGVKYILTEEDGVLHLKEVEEQDATEENPEPELVTKPFSFPYHWRDAEPKRSRPGRAPQTICGRVNVPTARSIEEVECKRCLKILNERELEPTKSVDPTTKMTRLATTRDLGERKPKISCEPYSMWTSTQMEAWLEQLKSLLGGIHHQGAIKQYIKQAKQRIAYLKREERLDRIENEGISEPAMALAAVVNDTDVTKICDEEVL